MKAFCVFEKCLLERSSGIELPVINKVELKHLQNVTKYMRFVNGIHSEFIRDFLKFQIFWRIVATFYRSKTVNVVK